MVTQDICYMLPWLHEIFATCCHGYTRYLLHVAMVTQDICYMLPWLHKIFATCCHGYKRYLLHVAMVTQDMNYLVAPLAAALRALDRIANTCVYSSRACLNTAMFCFPYIEKYLRSEIHKLFVSKN